MAECIELGCLRPAKGRGLCGTHYAFHRRHQTLPPLPEPVIGCSVEGCEGRHEAKGLCKFHYQRMYQTGSLETPACKLSDEERFWAKVDRVDDSGACWLWLGGMNELSYGHVWWGGRTRLAHRISYELLVGPIPDGLTLDHLCTNPWCVNPVHLEPVTQQVNNIRADGVSGVNARKTHCKRGHEFTPENTYRPPKKPDSRYCRKCQYIRDGRWRLVVQQSE